MHPEKIQILKDRAKMFYKAREFFRKRGVIEVDCPIMSPSASIDVHIELIRAYGVSSTTQYLHASPEYGMKKLLAEGMSDIFQLCHVFRDEECSMQHNPEFTMVEWYRINVPFSAMIEESIEFIKEFVGDVPFSKVTYRDAFKRFAGIDYLQASEEDLLQFLEERGINPYQNIEEEGKDALLNIILGVVIQPQLGQKGLTVVQYFPATQAALAQTRKRGEEEIAERFEIFYQGVELANGYHELTNSEEQHERLIHSNATRERLGKDTLPIDDSFIKALEKGLPDCCGVSVGFDRLMMLRHKREDIADVIPLSEK
ncbi:MAG: Elongation factor P--(R)-beta-lysine ligase [Chlamydiae bacterium]|nr:Elongation factor P--(R)-beta-lysine ligase [Chlamydiota bacterium]